MQQLRAQFLESDRWGGCPNLVSAVYSSGGGGFWTGARWPCQGDTEEGEGSQTVGAEPKEQSFAHLTKKACFI
jgi:hypothetical protein